MDSSAGTRLYPLHRRKTLHLVRHAQGIHNVAGEMDHSAYMSYDFFDAHLTPLGWKQVYNLWKHVQAQGLSKRIELFISLLVIRSVHYLLKGNGRKIPKFEVPPTTTCHEGVHPCDKRSSISEYRLLFPAVDFSLIESDDDILWTPDVREKNEEVALRGKKFLNRLWTRKEKEISIVSHSGFLCHTLSSFGNDCHPPVKSEICTRFANCELRSLVIVDKSMMGSDKSETNYPGKIPSGLELPSDIEKEKNPEMVKDN